MTNTTLMILGRSITFFEDWATMEIIWVQHHTYWKWLTWLQLMGHY